MSFFKTKQLLQKTAALFQREKESFSKTEIVKKINEIKYLSAQKKIPKLSLRKEIIHLENQLQGIFELEKKLLLQKKRESAEITAMKRQNERLKKKLEVAEDKELQKKVNKLSYLLGDYLAKYGSKKDIETTEKLLGKSLEIRPLPSPRAEAPAFESRITFLRNRLDSLKKELAAKKLAQNPQEVEAMEEKIKMVEEKLELLEHKPFAAPDTVNPEIKHELLFGQPQKYNPEEKALPLPPPPRITK